MTATPMARSRTEADSLGTLDVPLEVYYGVQTLRAARNFRISGTRLDQHPALIVALGMIKLAAARANHAIGDLDNRRFEAIERACRDVIEGRLNDQFILDVFQGGAGTSTNMNANEVIANRALEHLGLPRGRYDVIHPNNDVNLSQSTNDVYPTAIRLSVLANYSRLSRALEALAGAFEDKAAEFAGILKLGRTQLQDAVPMTLGQEFGAFAATLREDVMRLEDAARLMLEVNLGGTAIGTGINADPAYGALVVKELAAISGFPLVRSQNLVEACWDTGAFVSVSGALKRTAVKLSKIANDLRLLSSGPRGGMGEINLPPKQPGSSIMPGKVNPVIPEVVNQVAYQVIGTDVTITMAAEAGQLQLNAMEPVILNGLMQSLQLLTNAVDTLREHCVTGITANREVCRRHLEAGTALSTALVPVLGYERAAHVAKQMLETGTPLRELLTQDPELTEELLSQIFNVEALVNPSRLRRSTGADRTSI